MMKAKIVKSESNARNYADSKELVGAYTVVGKINGEMRQIVTARAYMGKSRNASVVYASLWVNAGELSTSGRGEAGGYGYHKESAAFQHAITSAGIELFGSPYTRPSEKPDYTKRAFIDGVGDSAMQSAFEAIARAAGAKGKLIFIRH